MSKKWGVKMEIKMNSISVVIKGKRIFSNITDTMNSGDMVALTGSSGCGKTTLLNCLGLIQPIEKLEKIGIMWDTMEQKKGNRP